MDLTAYIKLDSNSYNALSSFRWNSTAFESLACFWTDTFWIQGQLLLSFCDPTDFLLLLKDQSRILLVADSVVMYTKAFFLSACYMLIQNRSTVTLYVTVRKVAKPYWRETLMDIGILITYMYACSEASLSSNSLGFLACLEDFERCKPVNYI